MDSSFGDDVGIETVAEVNGIDVVTAEQTTLLDCIQFVRNSSSSSGTFLA